MVTGEGRATGVRACGVRLPRVMVAAAASGGGKTTVATGLMAALRRRGHVVAAFKVGPDYIDPGYHTLATGRPGRNLDAVMCGPAMMAPLLAHGALTPTPADIGVIEGVMGLFDGRLGSHGDGSSAQVAALTSTPVLLVVDARSASRTHAAVAAGLAAFDPEVRVRGAILNMVGSARHTAEITDAFHGVGIPVLGALPRSEAISVPSRHLGLVPAAERGTASGQLQVLADQIERFVDLDAIVELCGTAPSITATPWDPAEALASAGFAPVAGTPVVAVAGGRAFTFRYAETAELLAAAGCAVVDFDPMSDAHLPAGTSGLYLGGGFPEVHAAQLAGNHELLADIGDHARAGMPVVAECAGLLYLCRTLDGHAMAGVVEADAAMTPRLSMGYRRADAVSAGLLAAADTQVIGHEFHRTRVAPGSPEPSGIDQAAPAASMSGPASPGQGRRRPGDEAPAWRLGSFGGQPGAEEPRAEGFSLDPSGCGHPTVHASYLHLHWAAFPQAAGRFAEAAAEYARGTGERAAAVGSAGRTRAGLVSVDPGLVAPELVEGPGVSTGSTGVSVDPGSVVPELVEGSGVSTGSTGVLTGSTGVSTGSTGASVGPEFVVPELVEGSGVSTGSTVVSADSTSVSARAGTPRDEPGSGVDLDHHGDLDMRPGLLDFAVNVRVPRPPDWLTGAIVASAASWAAYPDSGPAREALAAMHGVRPGRLLPTSGAAEAFSLVARAIDARHAVVVHPQFTEPEAALRRAGRPVDRVVLRPDDGFVLDSSSIPASADLVIVGNPTNPTGVLHDPGMLRGLCRPGRVVMVDEAFMDAGTGNPGGGPSLLAEELPGLIVVRSLTKAFGLAGVRAGYVVGDPGVITRLEAQQPPWAVSTPALAAMVACCTPAARAHAAALARELPPLRDHLVSGLRGLGLGVVAGSQAPFVLVDTSSLDARASIREPLARRGIAVRGAETFPGLGPTWIRLAVRGRDDHERLFAALAGIAGSAGQVA